MYNNPMNMNMKIILSFIVVAWCSFAYADFTNYIGMRFVDIKQGEFHMGSCNGGAFLYTLPSKASDLQLPRTSSMLCPCNSSPDPQANTNEYPQHKVRITRHIQMGQYETTVNQFRSFISAMNRNDLLTPAFNATNKIADQAVTYVSWRDVMDFIQWLNANKPSDDKGNYRLPSEAEWEYSARAESVTHYYFDDNPVNLHRYAWYHANSNVEGPFVVGKKIPNAWALYDMHGNVWEWVRDWYQQYQDATQTVDPLGPQSGAYRVVRGGSWKSTQTDARSAARRPSLPGLRSNYVGFRVVRDITHQ